MTGRMLRIELLRTNARWLALFLLAFVTLTSFGQAERGLTVIALDQRELLRGGAFPLALGAAAWQARRDRRARMDELLATTPRPRWQRVLPAATALGIGAVAAYLAAIAVHLVLVVTAGGYVSAATVPIIAVGALGLLVPVSFGLALGRWLPLSLIPPVLVAFFALTLFYGDTEAYTEGPGASGEVPGEMLLWGDFQVLGTSFETVAITARAHLGQAVWMAGLVAAGLIVFSATRPRTRAAAVPVLVGTSFSLVLLPIRYADAYYPDPGATALVCTPDTPKVCVLRAHRAALTKLRGPAREALATLAAKLPDAPTSVVEIPDPYGRPVPPPPAGTVYLGMMVGTDGEIRPISGTVPDIRWDLLLGAGTPGCANAPAPGAAERRRYDIARLIAAAWLLDQEPPAPADPADPALLQRNETLPGYRELRALPAGEQRARVAALREAELGCTAGDRLDLLVGPGGPQ